MIVFWFSLVWRDLTHCWLVDIVFLKLVHLRGWKMQAWIRNVCTLSQISVNVSLPCLFVACFSAEIRYFWLFVRLKRTLSHGRGRIHRMWMRRILSRIRFAYWCLEAFFWRVIGVRIVLFCWIRSELFHRGVVILSDRSVKKTNWK